MKDIQEVWDTIQEYKREQKEIKSTYRDMLKASSEYEDTIDELQTLKAKKKQIETGIQNQMGDKSERLELLAFKITEAKQLMADLALSTLVKGERVTVKGAGDAEYEPIFAVSFKKKG